MTGQFEIRPSTAVDAPTLSLLGQATFLEAFAGILNGPDILAHCAGAHAADLYASWLGRAIPDLDGVCDDLVMSLVL